MTDVLLDVMFGVAVDMLSKLMFDIGVDMLSDIDIIVEDTAAIDLEFVVLAGLLTVLLIDHVTAIDVNMLADENANSLAAVVTPSEFTLTTPWEESIPFG